MDDWNKHDWDLDLSDLRYTLPQSVWAKILLAVFGATAVIAFVAIFFGR